MAVFSGCAFLDKKTINISNQSSVISNQETVNNDQKTRNNEQQTENIKQKTTDSNQSSVISNQKKENTEINDKQTEAKNTAKIVEKFVSWGFEKSTSRKIDTIVVHSTYNTLSDDPYSSKGVLEQFKTYGVAAHYLIDRKGTIYKLVDEKNIAYHAGESKMPDGRTGVNAFSLGVEMMNTEDGKFTSEQYSALNDLIAIIKNKYAIKYILGHDDIAPGRKTDPWNINWDKVIK